MMSKILWIGLACAVAGAVAFTASQYSTTAAGACKTPCGCPMCAENCRACCGDDCGSCCGEDGCKMAAKADGTAPAAAAVVACGMKADKASCCGDNCGDCPGCAKGCEACCGKACDAKASAAKPAPKSGCCSIAKK